MNRVCLVGRITKDPTCEYVNSKDGSVARCRFTLAVNRPFQGQNGEQGTDFINIVVWRKQAENVAKYVSKGSLVAVEGRIQTGSYEKDGQRIYTTDVVADSVQFLETKAQSQNRAQDDVSPADFVNQDNGYNNESDMSDEVFANFGDSIEISDDDIAF